MKKKILYVGLDVHKKSIDVAITEKGVSGKVRSYGKIDATLFISNADIWKFSNHAIWYLTTC